MGGAGATCQLARRRGLGLARPVMRILTVLIALSLVAGSAVAAPVPKPGQKGTKDAASFPLAGQTPEEVKAWLGEPAVANEECKGAFWTYRLEDCALMVFFK